MSGLSTASAAESSALDPTTRQRLASLRRPAIVAGIVVAAALILSAAGATTAGYLDPDAADPTGGRALRVLLEDGGVTVTRVTSTDAALSRIGSGSVRDATLVVPDTAGLLPNQIRALMASNADIVLLDPDADIGDFVPELTAGRDASPGDRDPLCTVAAAARAGRAYSGGISLKPSGTVPGSTIAFCYGADGLGTLAQVRTSNERIITVVGSGEGFTNDRLASEGNAALGLSLFGAHQNVVWVIAPPTLATETAPTSFTELLPRWVGLAVLQLALAVLLLALWRGRRFGPIVTEQLPVVVRAAEATEGRARLYRRSRARDRAAENLRRATLQRLRSGLGLQRNADPTAVTAVVSARSGRPAADVASLLFGTAPTGDEALVRLAHELDILERTVRRA